MRWSDIDSNLHLRNSAYVDYMSHTRMRYFSEKDFPRYFGEGGGWCSLLRLGGGAGSGALRQDGA